MSILVISVDLQCCRCRAKITKVLDCLEAEFGIEKVEFEDKNNKVVVRGKFDAEKLCKKVWCKAGKIVIATVSYASATQAMQTLRKKSLKNPSLKIRKSVTVATATLASRRLRNVSVSIASLSLQRTSLSLQRKSLRLRTSLRRRHPK